MRTARQFEQYSRWLITAHGRQINLWGHCYARYYIRLGNSSTGLWVLMAMVVEGGDQLCCCLSPSLLLLACLLLPPISSTVYRLWEVMEMEFIPIQQILMDSKDRMQMKSQRRLRWLCPDVYFEWFLILTDFSLLYVESETMQPSSSLCCCCYRHFDFIYCFLANRNNVLITIK